MSCGFCTLYVFSPMPLNVSSTHMHTQSHLTHLNPRLSDYKMYFCLNFDFSPRVIAMSQVSEMGVSTYTTVFLTVAVSIVHSICFNLTFVLMTNFYYYFYFLNTIVLIVHYLTYGKKTSTKYEVLASRKQSK